MEASSDQMMSSNSQQQQQLPFSIESFTYSWCINLNPPSLESLSNSLRFSLDHTLSDYFEIDFLETPDSDHLLASQAEDSVVEPRGGSGETSWASSRSRSSVLRRCKGFLSKQILKRCLGNLIMRIISGRGFGKRVCSSKVDSLIDDHSFHCGNNRRSSSCNSETSIHEAVLHCKRSIGNY